MGLPRAVRLAAGISCTLSQYSLPLVVMGIRYAWVQATKRSVTKSSSFVVAPVLPRPPRLCARYSVSGAALHVAGVATA